MAKKIIEISKAERQLLLLTANEAKGRMQIHVELLNEPFLTELCEALLKYILLGETTHFDSRVMRGMYERAIEMIKEDEGRQMSDRGLRTSDAEEGVCYEG